jgi:hypothetical protein
VIDEQGVKRILPKPKELDYKLLMAQREEDGILSIDPGIEPEEDDPDALSRYREERTVRPNPPQDA